MQDAVEVSHLISDVQYHDSENTFKNSNKREICRNIKLQSDFNFIFKACPLEDVLKIYEYCRPWYRKCCLHSDILKLTAYPKWNLHCKTAATCQSTWNILSWLCRWSIPLYPQMQGAYNLTTQIKHICQGKTYLSKSKATHQKQRKNILPKISYT